MLSGHWLNDVNPHLINFYLWLQRGLVVRLHLANDKELYYAYRARFNELIADPETAASQEALSFSTTSTALATTGCAGSINRERSTCPLGATSGSTTSRTFPTTRLY